MAQTNVPGAALPLRFGEACITFGFLVNRSVDEFDHGVVFFRRGDAEPDLVPHPLAHRREVKILTLDGEAVDETDAAARRMALIRPVARLEHGGSEKTDLRNLACDAIDLHPIANPDAMLTHQYKPAKERNDEVLQDKRESGSGEAEDGGHFAWGAEDNKQDDQHAEEVPPKRRELPRRGPGTRRAWRAGPR